MVITTNGKAFKIGIIGGTGLEDPDIMKRTREYQIDTPFGLPSDSLIEGEINGIPCVLLSRHGRSHALSPTNINYRANIWALKEAGVGLIIASAACGSLKDEVVPGDVVLLDSFIDRTTKREQTFYDGKKGHPQGVCHIPMHPVFNEKLRQLMITISASLGILHHSRGTMVCVEGPRFSTRAESELFRQWTATVVGMTVCPEVVLAKELGIPYVSVAIVTDYDCWKDTHEGVSIDLVAETMRKNANTCKSIFIAAIKEIDARREEFHEEIQKAKKVAMSSVMGDHRKMDFGHIL